MKNKSFTLIELLVVIVIIGILAGVIMISTSSSIDKASIAKSKVFEESVQNNLAANMVSAWDADHVTKGTTWVLNDKWGNNNGTFYDGTVTTCSTTACPQIVNDKNMGNVLFFDGVNDSIFISGSSLNHYNDLTYSLWFKCSTQTASAWNFFIFKEQNNMIEFGFYGSGLGFKPWKNGGANIDGDGIFYVGTATNYSDNVWHLVNATIKNNVVETWIDGVLKGHREDYPYPQTSSNSNHYIGSSSGGSYYEGYINDIRIYNSGLSSAQIKKNYIYELNKFLAKGFISENDYKQRIDSLSKN